MLRAMATATPLTRFLPSLDDPRRNFIRDAWDRLHGFPGGKRVFSELVGRAAPYTATIGARVERLRRGHATVTLRDRKAVRNHLDCVHAIALANLAELCGNVAIAYTLPVEARFIVAGMTIDYEKKARGTITATADVPLVASADKREYDVPVTMTDPHGDVVARATLRTLVGPKKQR